MPVTTGKQEPYCPKWDDFNEDLITVNGDLATGTNTLELIPVPGEQWLINLLCFSYSGAIFTGGLILPTIEKQKISTARVSYDQLPTDAGQLHPLVGTGYFTHPKPLLLRYPERFLIFITNVPASPARTYQIRGTAWKTPLWWDMRPWLYR